MHRLNAVGFDLHIHFLLGRDLNHIFLIGFSEKTKACRLFAGRFLKRRSLFNYA